MGHHNMENTMLPTLVYHAYSIEDQIDVKSYRTDHPEKLASWNSRELYYSFSDSKSLYILNYGAVVFLGFSQEQIYQTMSQIGEYVESGWTNRHEDQLQVFVQANEPVTITFESLHINRFDHEVNKLIMLDLAQSVTLDYFNGEAQGLLREIKAYTEQMYEKGQVRLTKRKALKFMGKTLKTKNNITENLYIIDSPEKTWEDEYIDQLHRHLAQHFELTQRYRSVENTLRIVEDNLEVFISYNHQAESSRLEWIIIILIVIEVVDTILSKF